MSPLIRRAGLLKAWIDEVGLWLNLLALCLTGAAWAGWISTGVVQLALGLGALLGLNSFLFALRIPRLWAWRWIQPLLLGLFLCGLGLGLGVLLLDALGAALLVLGHALGGAHAAQDTEKLKLTLITGFLGAGKTTLVNQLLQSPMARDAAVIVNEWGKVSIDHLLVRQVDERMVALPNGCVCCALRGDLVSTIRELLTRARKGEIEKFKRVLIETSGLADPAPVLQTLALDPWLRPNAELTGVVTVVDGQQGLATLERHPESLRQVAVADLLLISKEDQASEETLQQLEAKLQQLAPFAERRRASYGQLDPALVLEVQRTSPGVDEAEAKHAAHTEALSAVSLERDQPISPARFDEFFEHIISNRGADLLRVKGFVYVEGHEAGPALIQGVQHYFQPVEWLDHWPEGQRGTRLVFIGTPETVQTLEHLWHQRRGAPRAAPSA